MEKETIEVIMPAYNEADSIGRVILQIREVLGSACRIVVVDDASEDATVEKAVAAQAQVIRHPYRMGNGACIKTGLRNAAADIVVLMDSDGQHDPRDIPRLLRELASFDMVIGARDFSKLGLRNCGNRCYNLFSSYVTRFPIKDLTSGFRAIKRRFAVKYIYLLPNGFSSPTTLTLSFLNSGRAITYVPVSCCPRKHGVSKINIWEDGLRFFLIMIRIAVFFSPLRVFMPVSFVFFISGFVYYVHTFIISHRFTNMSVLLFTASLIIFMLGLVSEQINQLRMDRTEA
jgi:glycosyltransferase involved in cell wall biosynthesis